MEESVPYMETPSASPSYGYTDPISSFFNGIFFIIILVLLIIFIVVIIFAQGVGYLTGSSKPPPEVKKEKFTDGPPYPSCKTNGALAMF
jgi:hypothetical protein